MQVRFFFLFQLYIPYRGLNALRKPTLNPDSSPSRDVALFSRFAVHTLRDYSRDDIVTFRFV